MLSIFIVGTGAKQYAETIERDGLSVRLFRSSPPAIKALGSANMIVMDASVEGAARLIRLARKLPKILIFSLKNSSTAMPRQTLMREPLTYPLFDPSPASLLLAVKRAMTESDTLREAEGLAWRLQSAIEENSLLEQMSMSLMTSQSPEEIYSAILKRMKKLVSADGWAYHMAGQQPGKLISSKYSSDKWKRLISRSGCKPSKTALKCEPVISTGGAKGKTSGCPFISVPVMLNSNVLGVIEVFRERGGSAFESADMERLVKLAGLAAHAVDKLGLQQKLEELVITDDLTKLFNTRYLHRSLETEIQRSSRYSTSVSLIFLDLDHFKNINDRFGHLAGSKLLAEVGQLLVNQLRGLDIVARYGGDEFVIVLPQTELYNAMLIAERIRKDIEQRNFLKDMDLSVSLTASFGVASYPETAHSKEDLIRIADESMYDVKRRNRNGVYAII